MKFWKYHGWGGLAPYCAHLVTASSVLLWDLLLLSALFVNVWERCADVFPRDFEMAESLYFKRLTTLVLNMEALHKYVLCLLLPIIKTFLWSFLTLLALKGIRVGQKVHLGFFCKLLQKPELFGPSNIFFPRLSQPSLSKFSLVFVSIFWVLLFACFYFVSLCHFS